ncbi:hypothetical protein AAHK07_10885 [Aliarcobacter cryaerophilus]|uniref:hypothetical protein n=1 Tax=Aliarcobacter cryaerophilus TaxID=28198 RepID=UPI00316FDC58
MRRKIAFIVSWLIGISVFICWMFLVGNPHINETIMGLVISGFIGGWINHKIDPWDL